MGAYLVHSRPEIDVASKAMFSELTLSANNGPGFGFMAEYGKYRIEVSPALFGDVRHRPAHGPTSFFDLKLSHYAKKWGADLYYQKFQGFYSDSNNFHGKLERENLASSVFILNAYFPVFGSSSVELMDKGIDDNGVKFNFLYLLGASNKKLSTDSTLLIPSPALPDSKIDGLRKLAISDVFGGLGGGVNTYFHGMYFDYTLFLGAGPQFRTANIPMDDFKGSLKVHMQANWGYEWRRFAFGITAKFDLNGFDEAGEVIVFGTALSKAYATMHL